MRSAMTAIQPLQPVADHEKFPVQEFLFEPPILTRRITLGTDVFESSIRVYPGDERTAQVDPLGMWWTAYLEGQLPISARPADRLGVADLFCGSGGLALGVRQLAAEMGAVVVSELIVDSDADATTTLAANHAVRARSTKSVTSLVDFRVRGWGEEAAFTYEPEILEDQIIDTAQRAHLLMAGPPCQGHSNLNNHSRRADMRNHLMLAVPAFAVAAGIKRVIIENVPAVIHDQSSVVSTTKALFKSAGYQTTDGVLAANEMGWPRRGGGTSWLPVRMQSLCLCNMLPIA